MIYFLHEFRPAKRTFWKMFQGTLRGIGDVCAWDKPLQYPRDVARCDLVRIGGDMHKAMGVVVKDIETQHGKTARTLESLGD